MEYSKSMSVPLCLTYNNTGGGHANFEVQVSLTSSQGIIYLLFIMCSSVCVCVNARSQQSQWEVLIDAMWTIVGFIKCG